MGVRHIRGAVRDRNGVTLALCLGEPGAPVVSVGQVIDDVDARRHTYLVDAGPRAASVRVVRDPDGAYLRTDPDADPANNLDSLPRCEDLPPLAPQPVRRDAATVGAEERRRLRDAILELNHRHYPVPTGPADPVSIWFKQDEVHQATHVHDEATFLAWHRALVNEFEAQLQQIDPTLALHYWDWTTHPERAPDGQGGLVNLFDEGFMGANGTIGSPFLEGGFYRPDPPNRYVTKDGHFRSVPFPADLPPPRITRALPVSGHGPREVTMAERDELWPPGSSEILPGVDEAMRVHTDEDLLRPFLFDRVGAPAPRPGVAFERFWRRLYIDHGLIHRFIGGAIGGGRTSDAAHSSFEDPFVFLLHSNVDRLWASWQLSPAGFDARAEPPWRLEPAWAYGQLLDGKVEVATDTEPFPGETQEHYDARYDAALARQGATAGREIRSTMSPWNGLPRPGSSERAPRPWGPGAQGEPGTPRPLRPIDRAVLRPPPYDEYTFERDGLAAAWATLLTGKRLSTHDVVRLTVEGDATDADHIEVVLQLGPDVSWWKGIRLPDWTMLDTEGALSRATTQHRVDELGDGQFIFHKAVPGRRIVFRVADMEWIRPGSRLTFLWEDD
ncbi:tyrosinase family protein [Cellulomonas timonensis]|uniref:tyrosinase family protein n=1 Tax=Cellulomonas timonensis TaxID=1689271 RepID=UPI000833B959|nr:tyrosinase family protein [Cellulomonas timonensis]